MSLRTKIILLFVGLAILPMLTLAAFGYWQAQSFLVGTVQDQLLISTSGFARDLDEKELEIQLALDGLARSPEMARVLRGEIPAEDLRDLLDPPLDRAGFIHLVGGTVPASTIEGSLPSELSRKIQGGSESLVEFTRNLPPNLGVGTLRAGFWTSDLIGTQKLEADETLLLLEASSGRVLFAHGNGGPAAGSLLRTSPELSAAVPLASAEPTRFKFRTEGQWRFGATVGAGRGHWILAKTSGPGIALSALNRLVTAYWAFVIGLAVATGLAFSLLLGRFTKSLRDLAKAAEEIGSGELSPWLPLSASGEVGQLTLAFNRMLARIREMLEQVEQSGRLAVVGQLSAYFAHEIRNPLSSVKMNLQRLERWGRQGRLPEFCEEPVEISLREVERLTESVSDVLQLSRAQDSPRDVFGLHDQVEESAHLLMAKFRNQGVDLVLDLDAEADLVLARPGQVKSVILNLMLNALEAQPNGGFLNIRSELTRSRRFGGPAVTVRFSDGGPGVPPDVRNRIFEPFFTTKSGGSGIGLAVADRAVRDNNGRLFLEAFPQSGSGAEFVMTFPLAAIEPDSVPVRDGLRRTAREPARRSRREILVGSGDPARAPELPAHLRMPEGLEAVMALALSDQEEVN